MFLTPKSPPPGPVARQFLFEVRSSKDNVVDTVSIIHTNRRDAGHAALRQVRRDHAIPQHVALFATQKTQEVK